MADSSNRETLLIVDDNLTNLKILEGLLGNEYNILTARSGYEALQVVMNQHSPSLILLDVMMPDINGYEVCRILKANTLFKDIPVIFITARGNESDETMGLEAGAVDYIVKPFSPAILRSRIRSQMELVRYRAYLEDQVAQRTRALTESQRDIIERLAHAAEYRDNETGRHIKRLSLYSAAMGREWGMDEALVEDLLHASSMHDIGKIGIPDKILLKADALSEEEWRVMKNHTRIGAELLSGGESRLMNLAETIALHHHERWDGEGYPRGLRGEAIPFEGRLVSICDVFDALTSWRPYKQAWTIDEASAYLNRESGRIFDPDLVKLFNRLLPELRRIHRSWRDLGEDDGGGEALG